MKVTWGWLKEHLDTTYTPTEIATLLTKTGTETTIAAPPHEEDFAVVRIESVSKHPNADSLSVCQVRHKGAMLTIVCGGRNVRAGMHTILAVPGQKLPGSDKPLASVTLRGVESAGMLCSARELEVGLPCPEGGILDLPTTFPEGTLLRHILEKDPVLDLEITPNRGDLLSVRGIARECAALGAGTLLSSLPTPMEAKPSSIRSQTTACRQFYTTLVTDVPTLPDMIGQRLLSIGQQLISPVVDLTNYLAHDLGQPMHAFDADTIKGAMTLRLSQKGERFEGLDKNTYVLPEGVLVLTDEEGIISLVGILGGLRTAWTATSKRLLLEAASFDPSVIARGGQLLKIFTQARFRCERGIDPALPLAVLSKAASMLGATTIEGLPYTPPAPASITLPVSLVSELTGVVLDGTEVTKRLKALSCGVSPKGAMLEVVPPSWRIDWSLPEDCVEEIIRVKGYAEIDATPFPFHPHSAFLEEREQRCWRGRRFLAQKGCCETVTWSFMDSEKASLFLEDATLVHIANPISKELAVMRPSIVPNLLDNLLYHRKHGIIPQPLFEWGPQFFGAQPLEQEDMLSAVFPCEEVPDWQAAPAMTFFDLKGIVIGVLEACGIQGALLETGAPSYYHPNRSARFVLEGKTIATLGALHPRLHKSFPVHTWMVEVFLSRLPVQKKIKEPYTPAKLQPVDKDLSFFVPKTMHIGPLLEALKTAAGDLLLSLHLIDLFSLGEEQHSITVRCSFQPSLHTLSDEELHALMDQLIQCARQAGATLRGDWA